MRNRDAPDAGGSVKPGMIRPIAAAATMLVGGMFVALAVGASASDDAASRAPPSRPGTASPGDLVFSGELQQGGWIRGKVPAGTTLLTLGGTPVGFAPDGAFIIAFDRI